MVIANLKIFGASLIFFVIGYLLGSFSWSVIISKWFLKTDVRKKGSCNAGATNVLRNFGWKFAIPVGVLDILKAYVAVVIAFLCRNYATTSPWNSIWIQIAGLGAVIGHIFPLYFKFKGGKAVATLLGVSLAFNWIIFVICLSLILILVFKIKIMSIATLISTSVLVLLHIIIIFIPLLNLQIWMNPLTRYEPSWLNPLIISIIYLIVILSHIPNIKRLIKKRENKALK